MSAKAKRHGRSSSRPPKPARTNTRAASRLNARSKSPGALPMNSEPKMSRPPTWDHQSRRGGNGLRAALWKMNILHVARVQICKNGGSRGRSCIPATGSAGTVELQTPAESANPDTDISNSRLRQHDKVSKLQTMATRRAARNHTRGGPAAASATTAARVEEKPYLLPETHLYHVIRAIKNLFH